jgi:hypothetical protein
MADLDLVREAGKPRTSWNRSFIKEQARSGYYLRPRKIKISVHTGKTDGQVKIG